MGFSSALAALDAGGPGVMESFGASMAICQDYLRDLKVLFLAHVPESDSEEVDFFKSVKPRFFSERMYRFERYQFLVNRPVGTVELVRAYLEGELLVLNRFFEAYRFQYLYFRTGSAEFDGLYFVRGAVLPFGVLSLELDADPGYSTAMDYLFSRFMALERLREELLSELALLCPPLPLVPGVGVLGAGGSSGGVDGLSEAGLGAGRGGLKRFDWTGEVINLVELGYGIWLSGQLNESKAGLQDIFRWLEESFGLEIGIPANRFREIRRRKRLSRTHFMELCQSRLLEYMDEDDVYTPGGKPNKRRSLGY